MFQGLALALYHGKPEPQSAATMLPQNLVTLVMLLALPSLGRPLLLRRRATGTPVGTAAPPLEFLGSLKG